MKNLPDKEQLDNMWIVATSGSIKTGTRPHYGFADLLYDYLTDTKPQVELDNGNLNERIAASLEESVKLWDEK
jgi:hypothetical protein